MRKILIIGALFSLLWCKIAHSEISTPDFQRLADCVHRIENGTWPDEPGKGEQYGIHSVKYKDTLEARQICIRTCQRSFKAYKLASGAKNGLKMPFLEWLSIKYCPVNHANWFRMVGYYYERG